MCALVSGKLNATTQENLHLPIVGEAREQRDNLRDIEDHGGCVLRVAFFLETRMAQANDLVANCRLVLEDSMGNALVLVRYLDAALEVASEVLHIIPLVKEQGASMEATPVLVGEDELETLLARTRGVL